MQREDERSEIAVKYGFRASLDLAGQLCLQIDEVKPGEEERAGVTARALLGLPAASPGVAPSRPTPTVAEAAKAALNGIGLKASSVKEYKRWFGHFERFVGPATPLGEVTQERFSEYADHVRANADWSAKTKNGYITAAQRIFTFHRPRNSGIPVITTKDLKAKRSAPVGESRDPYTSAELQIVFSAAAEFRTTHPARWWVTVASAFLGTRIEELCQAHIARDFRVDPDTGIRYLRIDEVTGSDGVRHPKSVKTGAGQRSVPLHPALIEAGFWDFLEQQRNAGAITPFERYWSAKRGTGGVKHSKRISNWGTDQLKKLKARGLIDPDRNLGYFHSMRHSFVTFLGSANVSDERRSALSGHSYGGINAQVYNKTKRDVRIALETLEQGLGPVVAALERVTRE